MLFSLLLITMPRLREQPHNVGIAHIALVKADVALALTMEVSPGGYNDKHVIYRQPKARLFLENGIVSITI